MTQKSIRYLHSRIDFYLRWGWIIFFWANLIYLFLFIFINFLDLKSTATQWQNLFLDHLQQAEAIIDNQQPASMPIVSSLSIDTDGTITSASTSTLLGMRLTTSGFFGKIDHLQAGQISVFFYPDMVDGIQRVYFVKRLADGFIVNLFEPQTFFPVDMLGNSNLFVVSDDIIWFSNDAKLIGNIYRDRPIYIDYGRLKISFLVPIQGMIDARLIVNQDITNEIGIMTLTAFILCMIFGGISLLIVKTQKDFFVLKEEHAYITNLIQTLSLSIFQADEKVDSRLETMTPALRRSFLEAENKSLQFEENQQVQRLVKKIIGDLLFLIDVLQVEKEKLRDNEAHFRSLFETMIQGVIYHDGEGKIITANPAAEQILGLSLNHLQGRTWFDPRWLTIHEDGSDFPAEALPAITALRSGQAVHDVMIGVFHPQSEKCVWININAMPLFKPGGSIPYEVYVSFEDITERKKAEEKLRATLEEKETLLREVHHRVKNNLQVMIALIKMRSGSSQDTETQRFLKELEGQARTMSLVYEQLYQAENLSQIAMDPYLRQLTSNVLESFGHGAVLCVNLDASLVLNVAQAMPCGMIVNELFTNVLKYAFPPGYQDHAAIIIKLWQEAGTYHLTVSDNGVGMPPELDWRSGQTLGLRLVNLWATHQLGGTMDVTNHAGTTFTITFKLEN